MTKLYVGNLPWRTNDAELAEIFARFGDVRSATVVMDRETGRSRGFGFVEMDPAAAQKAITELNGTELGSRQLRVSEANERPPRERGADRGGDRSGDRSGRGGPPRH
jgi:cold-inducible RNA-binding protein